MERVFTEVNNGVYRCGFAGSQEAYDAAYDRLFTALDWLEERLADRRYLMGDAITEADVRLFTTLARFDAVYHGHFKCNRQKLTEMPALWGYARDLFQTPGFGETIDFDQIKPHYYVVHTDINPTGIVPRGPDPRLAGAARQGPSRPTVDAWRVRPSVAASRTERVATTPDQPPRPAALGMGHDHGHAPGRPGRGPGPAAAGAGGHRRASSSVEVVGAWVTGSLALLADAGHMATDAAAVVLALGASYVATRAGGPRSTFGYHRAEVLAALVNALVLLGVCGYLLYAGISRLADPQDVEAGPMIALRDGRPGRQRRLAGGPAPRRDAARSTCAVPTNEVFADLLGSLLAIAAGVVIWTTGCSAPTRSPRW